MYVYLQLMVHQRTHPPCVSVAGKCYYHEYCKYTSTSVDDMRQHLLNRMDLHLQSLTVKVHELEQVALKNKDLVCNNSLSDIKQLMSR